MLATSDKTGYRAMEGKEMPKCRLCLEERPLCKSHIYPEYMYKSCYDGKHSYFEFNAEKKSRNKKRWKGLYERLFCRGCEDIFQRYEDYAKKVLYDNVKPRIKAQRKPCSLVDYDYTKFKLFILSLLWRASISSLDSFKLANLGKYEEGLRAILHEGLETSVDNYPCILFQTHIKHDLSDGVFMEIYPGRAKADGRTIYRFIADGLFIFVGVGLCSIKSFQSGSSVSPENLRIGYDDLNKLDDFMDCFGRLAKQNKFSVYGIDHNTTNQTT